jgi:hypothetical protein
MPAKSEGTEGTWVQITFTLDPGYYRILWRRAESEGRPVSELVRDAVTHYLEARLTALGRKSVRCDQNMERRHDLDL